jgi:citrate lyase subunit beta/citryl-CoA lyase
MTLDVGPALLFCPGDRPERFEKAAARADAVIIDIEDAVPAERKGLAREALVSSGLDPDKTMVRINTALRADFEADLTALDSAGYRTVVVGKCEDLDLLDRLERYEVVAQCETPRGYHQLSQIAEHRAVSALFWGPEDLAQAIGAWSSRRPRGGFIEALQIVRSALLLAAAAAGKTAIDAPYSDYTDLDGLFAETADAAASGFVGKACIHPNQVAVIRRAYTPSSDVLEKALKVVAAASATDGAFGLSGSMVDAPLVAQARRIVSWADQAGGQAVSAS